MDVSRGRFGVRVAVVIAVSVVVSTGGCDDGGSERGVDTSTSQQKQTGGESALEAWEAGEAVDLLEPDDEKRREIELAEPSKYPDCRELFEPEGEPLELFLPDREDPPMAVAGCRPEAYERREDRRFVAYSLRGDDAESGDMRVLSYEDDALAWSARIDRSAHADSFTANYRTSFLAPLLPRLVCAGTLWEGSTQVVCWKAETGERVWGGELDFWSGIPLQGRETSLHGADISGLTRRYPYSGVEMRRHDFEHRGGHGALYATDGTRLFFAPEVEGSARLTAYGFDAMRPEWRVELPGQPDVGYQRGMHPQLGLGLVKIDEALFAFDLSEGDLRWRAHVGANRPSTAASEQRLYLLVRRSEESNLLYALDPASSEVAWYAPVPTGTLEVDRVDGRLILRSVHAIQRLLDEQ